MTVNDGDMKYVTLTGIPFSFPGVYTLLISCFGKKIGY